MSPLRALETIEHGLDLLDNHFQEDIGVLKISAGLRKLALTARHNELTASIPIPALLQLYTQVAEHVATSYSERVERMSDGTKAPALLPLLRKTVATLDPPEGKEVVRRVIDAIAESERTLALDVLFNWQRVGPVVAKTSADVIKELSPKWPPGRVAARLLATFLENRPGSLPDLGLSAEHRSAIEEEQLLGRFLSYYRSYVPPPEQPALLAFSDEEIARAAQALLTWSSPQADARFAEKLAWGHKDRWLDLEALRSSSAAQPLYEWQRSANRSRFSDRARSAVEILTATGD